jgi:hypothetical protein
VKEEEEEEEEDGDEEADRKKGDKKKGENDDKEDDEGKDEKKAEPIEIDLEGFESRVVVLPPEAGNISSLAAVSGKLIYHRMPNSGSIDESRLIAYYDLIDDIKKAVSELLEPITEHLRRVSALSVLRCGEDGRAGRRFNIAVRHAVEARSFLGTRYWDDVLDELARPGSPAAECWVSDLAVLSPVRRRVVLQMLVEWGVRDVASFGRFLIPLRERASAMGHERLFEETVDIFMSRCAEEPMIADRFAALFASWPTEVDHFLSLLGEARLERLGRLVSTEVSDPELACHAVNLRHLVQVHAVASETFMERFRSVARRHPQALRMLHDPAELKLLADTLYGQAEGLSDLFSRREWLEAYLDLEMVRLGLEMLGGAPFHRLLQQYRRGMHILLRSIYFMCRRELDDLYELEPSSRHLLGILLESGCKGFHPFDPQLRLEVLLFEEDAEVARFFGEVVASFGEELSRLGLEPTRLWDHSGPLEPRRPSGLMGALLSTDDPASSAVERLAVLKLSRVVGTRGVLERFTREVVEPLLAPIRGQLRPLISGQIESRAAEAAAEPGGDDPLDLVTMPGGISDLEGFFLVVGAERGLVSLCNGHPACAPDGSPGGAQLEHLRRSAALFQTLIALRRLVRSELPGEGVGASFIHENEDLMRPHPEVPEELLRDPISHLRGVAAENLRQMRRFLEIRADASGPG